MLAIVIIIVLLINSAGLFYFYLAQRSEIRTNMFAWLKTGEADKLCTVFDFPVNTSGNIESNNFSWELTDKEFMYKDNLYDVVAIDVNNGIASIRCVADNEEDHLLQKIRVFMNHQKDDKPQSLNSLLKFFTAFISVKTLCKFHLYSSSLVVHRTAFCNCSYAEGFYKINIPPPKMG